MSSNSKHRNFAGILYPESLPEEWNTKLEKLGIPMAISPLHDQDQREDVNIFDLSPEDQDKYKAGKLYKKEHYHLLYCAPNPVTVQSVRQKIQRVLGPKTISHIEVVDSVENYFQYLTHESKDAKKKKKHVYDKKDIVTLSNFDIDRYISLDEHQKKDLFNAVTHAIWENQLANIFDLLDYIREHGKDIGIGSESVLNDVIAKKTGLLRLYFDGAYQRQKQVSQYKLNQIRDDEPQK